MFKLIGNNLIINYVRKYDLALNSMMKMKNALVSNSELDTRQSHSWVQWKDLILGKIPFSAYDLTRLTQHFPW